MISKKSRSSGSDKTLAFEEQQAKINEVRKFIGPLHEKFPFFFTDDSVSRYLRARNWNVKKASKMLKETLKWRLEYKPEKICWEEISREAETGKIYRTNYLDKYGRAVLVMRPGFQNTTSTRGQIRYLVYCMENAILNLAPNQEQMVWLIDFQGWNTSSISVKVTRETVHVLQNRYPERLGLAILYNPPKIFESFWVIVKPFLEPKTFRKVKFVYSDDKESQKIMEDLFDTEKLEAAFGGRNSVAFNLTEYGERMKEDDKKMQALLNSKDSSFSLHLSEMILQPSESLISDPGSEASDEASSSDFALQNIDEDGAEVAAETQAEKIDMSEMILQPPESLISDPGSNASDEASSSNVALPNIGKDGAEVTAETQTEKIDMRVSK